jgi:hypothetical protein
MADAPTPPQAEADQMRLRSLPAGSRPALPLPIWKVERREATQAELTAYAALLEAHGG